MTSLLKLTEYYKEQDAIKADIARVANVLADNLMSVHNMTQIDHKYTGFEQEIFVGGRVNPKILEGFYIRDEMMKCAVPVYGDEYDYYSIPVSYLDMTDEQLVAECKRIGSAIEAAKQEKADARDKADYELYLKLKARFEKA